MTATKKTITKEVKTIVQENVVEVTMSMKEAEYLRYLIGGMNVPDAIDHIDNCDDGQEWRKTPGVTISSIQSSIYRALSNIIP